MKFIINKQECRLKNITYHTDHDLHATYKGYNIEVAEQETGGFNSIVLDPKGKKIIDNHMEYLYLHEAVKDIMITICSKISRECAKRVCSRNYIGYLHCPYEYSSCIKCHNYK